MFMMQGTHTTTFVIPLLSFSESIETLACPGDKVDLCLVLTMHGRCNVGVVGCL